jgi:hypothetical protein
MSEQDKRRAAVRKYQRSAHGKAHRAQYLRRIRSANRLRVDAIKQAVGCTDCGYNENPVALDFDHLGSKSNNVSEMMNLRWERIEAEIAKCVVRCANCHRIKTHKEKP